MLPKNTNWEVDAARISSIPHLKLRIGSLFLLTTYINIVANRADYIDRSTPYINLYREVHKV